MAHLCDGLTRIHSAGRGTAEGGVMGEQEKMAVIGMTVTRANTLKAKLATLQGGAEELAVDLERIAKLLRHPGNDESISIPEAEKIRAILEQISDTAAELASEERNLASFGIVPKD